MSTTVNAAHAVEYINYELVAMAKLTARTYGEPEIETDALVAACRRMERHGWLSGQIDPQTGYTMRPHMYTPAEHAVIRAELDLRKWAELLPDGTHTQVKADAEHLRRTRTEPATEHDPETAEAAWFAPMVKWERQAWLGERARNAAYALTLLKRRRAA